MLNGEVWLLTIAGVLSIAALVVGYFIIGEVLRVMKDFFRNIGTAEEDVPSASHQKRPSGLRSRATVERLITHFEEPESGRSRQSSSE